MSYNFSGADKPESPVARAGIYLLQSVLIPGGIGPENIYRRTNKDPAKLGLEFRHKIICSESRSAEFHGIEIRDWPTVEIDWAQFLASPADDVKRKLEQAASWGRYRLRRILDSANGIAESDKSDAANAVRQFDSLWIFDGLRFVARLSIEPVGNGNRFERNRLDEILTLGDSGYFDPRLGKENARKPSPIPFDDEVPF